MFPPFELWLAIAGVAALVPKTASSWMFFLGSICFWAVFISLMALWLGALIFPILGNLAFALPVLFLRVAWGFSAVMLGGGMRHFLSSKKR